MCPAHARIHVAPSHANISILVGQPLRSFYLCVTLPFRYVFLFQTPFLPHRLLPTLNYLFIDLLYHTWSPGSSFSSAHMQHVKDTLSRPGCTRAAVKFYTGLRSFKSLKLMFSQCNVPALQLAGQCDGCMGADVRRRAHNMLHFGCEVGCRESVCRDHLTNLIRCSRTPT